MGEPREYDLFLVLGNKRKCTSLAGYGESGYGELASIIQQSLNKLGITGEPREYDLFLVLGNKRKCTS